MYTWIWRHLPGGLAAKLIGCALLLTAVVALLFFVVFPWAEPRLPFNDVTVDQGQSAPSGSSHGGSTVPESPWP